MIATGDHSLENGEGGGDDRKGSTALGASHPSSSEPSRPTWKPNRLNCNVGTVRAAAWEFSRHLPVQSVDAARWRGRGWSRGAYVHASGSAVAWRCRAGAGRRNVNSAWRVLLWEAVRCWQVLSQRLARYFQVFRQRLRAIFFVFSLLVLTGHS